MMIPNHFCSNIGTIDKLVSGRVNELVNPTGQDFTANSKNESGLQMQKNRITSNDLNYRLTWPHFIPE